MATYAELEQESRDGTLFLKVKVACFIAANTIASEAGATPNHANRLLWAKQVYNNPESEARRMLWAVLAANQAQTLAAIVGATDAQVQTAVNGAIDVFANGTA
jgi:hypothetical protein